MSTREQLHEMAVELAMQSAQGRIDPELAAVQLRSLEIALKTYDFGSKTPFKIDDATEGAELNALDRQKRIYQGMETGDIPLDVGLKLIKALNQLTDVQNPRNINLSGALTVDAAVQLKGVEDVISIATELQNQMRLMGDQIVHLKAELAYFIHKEEKDEAQRKWTPGDDSRWAKRFDAGIVVATSNKNRLCRSKEVLTKDMQKQDKDSLNGLKH